MTKSNTSSRPRGRPPKDPYDVKTFSDVIPDNVERLLRKSLLVTYFVDEKTNSEPNKEDIAKFWIKASDKVSAYIIGQETCPTTKRVHFHAVFTAETQFSFRGIDKITIPGYTRPNVRAILKGEENLKRAINYCGKEDNDPLLHNYTSPPPKFSFCQSKRDMMKTLSYYHDDPSQMSVADTASMADVLNIPLCRLSRFKSLVRQLKDITKNPCYKQGSGDRSDINVPKVIDVWMQHLKAEKVGLVIRAFDPESVYDLISSYGPHIFHDGNVNFEQFELGHPVENATFRVMKGIPVFNAKAYGGIEHITYLEPLLRGSGEFTYKDKILYNDLPVVFIEKTTSRESFWDMYGSYLPGCLSVEILGFSKYDAFTSLNKPAVINDLNEDEDIDCLKDSLYRDDVEDFVVVRYAPKFCRKTFGVEVDERMGFKKKPRSLNRYNYTAMDEVVDELTNYEPDIFVPNLVPMVEKMVIKGTLEEYMDKNVKEGIKLFAKAMYSNSLTRGILFTKKGSGAVRLKGAWQYKEDMSEYVKDFVMAVLLQFFKREEILRICPLSSYVYSHSSGIPEALGWMYDEFTTFWSAI